jgi:hypothetical protein
VGGCLIFTDESSRLGSNAFWGEGSTTAQRCAALGDGAKARDLFEWNPTLDGMFLVQFSIGEEPQTQPKHWSRSSFVLRLPTGVLAARSVTTDVRVLTVPPGVYRGVFFWDFHQENLHAGLQSVDLYPRDDGPDGHLILTGIQ